ncbi:CCR4-NOT transcription complex subunit 7 [Allomyces arbusculus]|nr:CCR4-NOT transcription complex subunit 7 [Allomyces arbusculus]
MAGIAPPPGVGPGHDPGLHGTNGTANGTSATTMIREVWADNLEQEMALLRSLVDKWPYLAMDTEFPGIVARPIGNFKTSADYHYQTLRCNVDLLKLIQLGITFADEHGNIPPNACAFQFNFKFSLTEDMYAQDSIDLLVKAGLDFARHEEHGIDVAHFGELLITSGLVLFPTVKWVSFHSGYDFGYLLKILTGKPLPADEHEFFAWLRLYFPCIYDIKYLMKACASLKGGLQDVADDLGVERIGPQHQAGSDALLTAKTFFKLRRVFFEDAIDDQAIGCLFGLGSWSGVSGTQGANAAAAAGTASASGSSGDR